MSSLRRPSALSDLLRQASAVGTDNVPPANGSTPAEVHRGTVTNEILLGPEELAEAFFPGSSLREHSFFPKSLTSHTTACWLGHGVSDIAGASPPRVHRGGGHCGPDVQSLPHGPVSLLRQPSVAEGGEAEPHVGSFTNSRVPIPRSCDLGTLLGRSPASSYRSPPVQPLGLQRHPMPLADAYVLSSGRRSLEQLSPQTSTASHWPSAAGEYPELKEPLLAHGAHSNDLEAATSTAEGTSPSGGAAVPEGASQHFSAAGERAPSAAEAAAAAKQCQNSSLGNALVFGAINAVVSMPTLIAYAAIVFKAPVYAPYLDSLCRFFFFSSAVHQLVFVCLSSLPFAIGQVQDVGLIFLSAMASDIALRVTGPGAAAVALGSSLLAMTLSTLVVGLLTMAVAHLKLADMVSYVPLPVVGGYLGFVGYFCIAGGTALAAGVQVDTLVSWVNLFAVGPVIKLLPAVATIASLMLCVEHVRHPLALPALLASIPLIFHGVLAAMGWTLADAQDSGWVMRPTAGNTAFWDLWGLFNLRHGGLTHGVDVSAIIAQLPKLAGLFLVVCFGSCMDVAAIQSDMPTPLDFNRELMTVGVSNLVTGALGAGYTGSYIFSQTIFTMRQGVYNRINGLVVAVTELLIFVLPFSVVQYMPNFFFGALLVWFGIEISRDWLILSYRKLSRAEYALLWATFMAICFGGLELGIAGGVVMATIYFAFKYAQSQVSGLRHVAARSGRTHVYETSSALEVLGRRMAVLQLSGYIFFGSSTGLGNQVLQLAARMLQDRAVEEGQHRAAALEAKERDGEGSAHKRQSIADAPEGPLTPTGGLTLGKAAPETPLQGREAGPVAAAERHWRAAEALARAPVVVILDFRGVSGMDSTAARTFATLVSTLASQHVNVVFVNLHRHGSRKLLQANGLPLHPYVLPGAAAPTGAAAGAENIAHTGAAVGSEDTADTGPVENTGMELEDSPLLRPSEGGCWEFPSAGAAVRCCEDGYLALARRVGLLAEGPSQAASLQQLLDRHLRQVLPSPPPDLDALVEALEAALTRRRLQRGEVLYRTGAAVQEVYVIEAGALVEEEHFESGVRVGSKEHGPGVVVGALEFFLDRPAPSTVRASSTAACCVLCCGRGALSGLLTAHPRALAALQAVLLRATCMDLASAQEAAHHGAAT